MRFANRPVLCEDLHDAVVGTRAVERRRRCAARHLDVLDVVGIEIGEPVLRVRARSEIGELRRSIVDDHAVDDVERIRAGDE